MGVFPRATQRDSAVGEKTHPFEREQIRRYSSRVRYAVPIARSNLRMLGAASTASIFIMALIVIQRCMAMNAPSPQIIPFAAALVVMIVLAAVSNRPHDEEWTVPVALTGVALFNACWYLTVFYYDTLIKPEAKAVLSCVAFVAIPALFDSKPLNKLCSTAVAFLTFAGLEFAFVSPALRTVDFANAVFAVAIGLVVGINKSDSAIGRLVLLDMYRASTKTSIWVSQMDLVDGSFTLLRAPSYIPNGSFDEKDNQQALAFAVSYIDADYREKFNEFLDPTTIAQRLEASQGKLSVVIRDIKGTWIRLTAVEQGSYKGAVTSVTLIGDDITGEVEAQLSYQKKLRQTALEAERANAAKTSFLRHMSHDVRTPINGIRGELLIAEHYPNDLARQAECRHKIREASDYLLTLVNNILDMSKLESGAHELESKPFDLGQILEDIAEVTQMLTAERKIELKIAGSLDDVPHKRVMGSPKHLQQVLANLSGNAVKYNRPGGTITLSCHELSFDGERALYEFTCADTGIGMSQEFQARMFEPFSQEERDENATAAGSGLGLSIVHDLVEQMGGTIECQSAVGQGTTFRVRLSLEVDKQAAAEKSIDADTSVDLTGKRALLVEDNDLNREIAVFILEQEGLTVDCAVNGQEAVEKFGAADPATYDIVFMDVMMPVMDGLAATRAIRALDRPDAQATPIVAMTANAFRDDVQRSHDAGMNEHLVKPLEPAKIHETLQKLLA